MTGKRRRFLSFRMSLSANRSPPSGQAPKHLLGHASSRSALTLRPLFLAVHVPLDADGSAGIFPDLLAERRAGGFLLFQRRQRLSKTQQRVRGFRRGSEFRRDRKE